MLQSSKVCVPWVGVPELWGGGAHLWPVAVPCSFIVGGHSGAQRNLGPAFPAPRAPAEGRATAGSPGPSEGLLRSGPGPSAEGDREWRAPQAFPCLVPSCEVAPCGRRSHPASTKAQEPRRCEGSIGYQTELAADPPPPRGERWGHPGRWADSPRGRRCAGTGRRTRGGKGFPTDTPTGTLPHLPFLVLAR